ncbi:MAG: hypothetical protein LBK27_07515 [Treponema sp.]|jgi:hypothetical protein|nr:hypothetical protein [Treponema sp.]
MRTKPFIAVLAFGVILASCASEIFTFDGRIELQDVYDAPPTATRPFPVGPTDSRFRGYAVIVSEDGNRYNIWPKELEERIQDNSSIKNHLIRFTVRPQKRTDGYGLVYVDGTVEPLSWEILDSNGEIEKDHYLRKTRWGTWNKLNLDPWGDWIFKAEPADGTDPMRPHIP